MALLDLEFNVVPREVRVEFDAELQQHTIRFNFSAQIPVAALLENLIKLGRDFGSQELDLGGGHRHGPFGGPGGDSGFTQFADLVGMRAAFGNSSSKQGPYGVSKSAGVNMPMGGGSGPMRKPPGIPGRGQHGVMPNAGMSTTGFDVDVPGPPPPPPPPKRWQQQQQQQPPAQHGQAGFVQGPGGPQGPGPKYPGHLGNKAKSGMMMNARSMPGMQSDTGGMPMMNAQAKVVPPHGGVAQTAMDPNQALLEAVRSNNLQAAQKAVAQGAEPNALDCLHHCLQCGGMVQMVSALLGARASVNAVNDKGQTALHLSMLQYQHLASIVFRMLLENKANVSAVDHKQQSPLDYVKKIASNLQETNATTSGSRAKMRQVLHELTEMPTEAIHVAESDIGKALFADPEGTCIIFYTRQKLSVFDIKEKKNITAKRLQNPNNFAIHSMAANPHTGTVAACIESPSAGPNQSPSVVIFVWKWRSSLTKELTKLTLRPEIGENRSSFSWPYTTDLTMSRNTSPDDPSTIVVRLCDGQVYTWTLDGTCTRALTERKLATEGQNIAISDDGHWIAVTTSGAGSPQTTVYYQRDSMDQVVSDSHGILAEFPQRHDRIAVARSVEPNDGHPAHGFLAAAYDAHGGSPGQAFIQVWSLPDKQLLHEFAQESNVRALLFSPQPYLLVSADDDGSVLFNDLHKKTKVTSCDEMYITSLDVSAVGNKIVSASNDYLRVYSMKSQAGLDSSA
eukprot:gnl/MRDRNA2_/MRDRNA2_115332_c0_seq1.p1 gnl/MRDRNA2_/MRDRNA2_115332_c0~~gnl/MRDRNA2_/MRDRNA2_115332_c0_seq1.p1  ORF type:complete len:734 (+),score=142.27 gnl/MRDRNA2_/MRDRNA2_115332_c0_seq1:113-2314(+)